MTTFKSILLDRFAKLKFYLVLLLFVLVILFSVSILANQTHNAVSIENHKFPTLDFITQPESNIEISLNSNLTDYYKCWYLKYNSNNWELIRPCNKKNFLKIVKPPPGKYEFRVDLKNSRFSHKIFSKKIGFTWVTQKLVKDIKYVPFAASLPQNTTINFIVKPGSTNLRNLEFKLWINNKTKYDWQSWPLPSYVVSNSGVTHIQVDIRLKANHFVQDKKFIVSLLSQDLPAKSIGNNLLRNLVADDFDNISPDKSRANLAYQLAIAIRLLLAQYYNWTFSNFLEAINKLSFVDILSVNHISKVVKISLSNDTVVNVDYTKCTWHQKESAIHQSITLASYPQYRDVFFKTGQYPDTAVASAITLAFFEGYQYGTPALFINSHASQPITECSSLAFLLKEALASNGFNSGICIISSSKGTHAITYSTTPSGKKLLLDATAGYIYMMGIDDITKKNIPKPITLIGNRSRGNIKEFNLKNLLVPPFNYCYGKNIKRSFIHVKLDNTANCQKIKK